MRTYKRWTNDEEQVVINQVKANPQNLTKAFFLASEIIHRSPNSIALRWYLELKEKSGIVFMTCSGKKTIANRKSVRENTTCEETKVTKSIWNKIIKLLFKNK